VVALANIPDIDAASPYYGVPDLSKLKFNNVKCPVNAYFGEKDFMKGFSTPEDGARLEKALNDDGVKVTLKYNFSI
jgi:carboxymethylenebutenolidase